ncbi:MAG: energy transducer TonB [Bdellovibrionales bacterium]|nr:energy transducer TonB [Bdellovibrionales bacterium]
MKVLSLKKDSSIISLGLSAFMHALIIVGFGFWGTKNQESFNLVKIPDVIAINLNGLKGPLKAKSLAVTKKVSEISATRTSIKNVVTKANMESDQVSDNGSSHADAGAVSGSPQGAVGGMGSMDALILSMKQKYFLEFRNTIENKKEYPTIARMRGIEGTVIVSVTIKKSGEVLNHKIIKASGSDVLDQSALNLVKKINSFKSFPNELGSEDIELKFPIAYSLNS